MLATMDYETYSEAGYRFDPALGYFVPIQKGKPGIKGINAAVYSEHPSTRIINLAYDMDDGKGERLWIPGMAPPQELFVYIAGGGLIEAHNSGFEYYIWLNVCHKRLGWPTLPLGQLRCSASKARAWSLPGALGKLSDVLDSEQKKDKRGEKLIQLLSIPKKPTKVCQDQYRSREKYPELYGEMYRYGIQDIVSEKSISAMIPELHPRELEFWQLDQRINTRGVAIDTEGLANCIDIFYQAERRYTDELKRITGGAVGSVGEMTKNSAGDKWMTAQGVVLSSLDKKHIEAALERTDLPPVVRRALEIRQIIGSASVKKLFAIDRCLSNDGRLRDLFIFCGAGRTGRFSGSGSQPQNLKNSGPDCTECSSCGSVYAVGDCPKCGRRVVHRSLAHDVYIGRPSLWGNPFVIGPDGNRAEVIAKHEQWVHDQPELMRALPELKGKTLGCWCGPKKCHGDTLIKLSNGHPEWGNKTTKAALETMATRDLGAVEAQWGDAVDIIASCMRGLFVAAPGHDLICSDYSAIEAVVLAAMAGEEWRLEVFRTHGKIYETSASKITGVPLGEILKHKERTGKHHPLRKKIGKIAELGSGYGGWINAWKNFGAGDLMTDDEIKQNILKWRDESPCIVEFWGGQWRKTPGRWEFTPELYGTEGAVISALQQPGKCFQCGGVTWGHDTRDDVLYGLLPSGRRLSYHQPRLTLGTDPRRLQVQKITFMGWNSNSAMGPVGWHRMETYGSRMVENIVQATSRDILRDAMLRLDAAGYPPVLHVHDEVVCEVLKGFGSVEEFERIMMIREPWFADWPIRAAGGWRGHRYRK